jgi:cell division transport system permease protein
MPPAADGDGSALAARVSAALDVLRHTAGIAYASAISEEDTLNLVAPWLGRDELVAELPMPRLIDATIAPGSAVDLASLKARLKAAVPEATLDDHGHWIGRLKSLADAVVWSAYGILLLIAVATASAVSFATRAGLQAHHEIVELLHQMGAQSGFIARSFERHYFLSALGAAAVGAAIAGILFVAAGGLEFAGIEAVPFLPPLALRLSEVPWLLAVPAVSGLIAWATARISVLAALRGIY